jgi:amide synthase
MFSVESYLSTIGYTGPVDPVLRTLTELHKQHVMSLPYDNSRLADEIAAGLSGGNIDLDVVFDRAVLARKGGHCGELAGLFHRLLGELGFEVSFLTAGLRGPAGTFGTDLAHVFLGVRLDGGLWLVDVGFAGPGYLEPLCVTDGVQQQYGCEYRITQNDAYHLVERKTRNGNWQALYRFKPQPRSLAEWNSAADDEEQLGMVMRSRAFDKGQLVLLGRRLTRVDEGDEEIRGLVKTADYEAVLDEIMGSGV